MASGGKKPFRVQRVSPSLRPGTFRGLNAQSRTAMQAVQFSKDLARFDRIIQGAEGMARRSLRLGARGLWSTHPEISVPLGKPCRRICQADLPNKQRWCGAAKARMAIHSEGRRGRRFF